MNKHYVLDLALVGITEEKAHAIMKQLVNSGGLLDSWGVKEFDYLIVEMEDYLEEVRDDKEDVTISKLLHT